MSTLSSLACRSCRRYAFRARHRRSRWLGLAWVFVFSGLIVMPATAQTYPGFNWYDAVRRGDIATVKELIAGGVDVNARPSRGYPPLIRASMGGHTEIVDLLLSNGSDVSVKDARGETALFSAAGRGHTEIVNLLLSGGADVNAKRSDGRTALFSAAGSHTEVVSLLLTNGADVTAKADNGETVLFPAAMIGHAEVVNLLLSYGADVNAKADNGMTALELAARMGQTDIAVALVLGEVPASYMTFISRALLRESAGLYADALEDCNQAIRYAEARGFDPDLIGAQRAGGRNVTINWGPEFNRAYEQQRLAAVAVCDRIRSKMNP